MNLWPVICSVAAPFWIAFNRDRNFLWLLSAIAGICARPDLLGVSSIVCTLGLAAQCYDRLLDFFHSPRIDLDRLTQQWAQIAIERFCPLSARGAPVMLADERRRMGFGAPGRS